MWELKALNPKPQNLNCLSPEPRAETGQQHVDHFGCRTAQWLSHRESRLGNIRSQSSGLRGLGLIP